jgi:cellulose synthase operon protein C
MTYGSYYHGRRSRTVNFKFVAWLSASLVLLTVGVISVHGVQIWRNAGIFKRQAAQAEEANRFDEAARYYQIYMHYMPDDGAARLARSRCLEKKTFKTSDDLHTLHDLYATMLNQEPDNREIRRKLVDVAVLLRRFYYAQQQIELLRAAGADSAELEELDALCCVSRGNNQEAVARYQKSIELDDQRVSSFVGQAAAYERLKQPEEADRVMKDLVKKNPKDYRAHLAYARHLSLRERPDEVAREVRTAYQLADDQADTLLAMAELAQLDAERAPRKQPKYDEARGYLRRALARYPDHAALYIALARVDMAGKKSDDAVEWLDRGLKVVRGQGRDSLLHMLGLLRIQRGEKEKAQEILNTLVRARAAPVYTEELRASLAMAEGAWAQAIHILERALPLVSTEPAERARLNMWLGHCYRNRNEPDQALTYYRLAAREDPRLVSARAGYAWALAVRGQTQSAIDEYQNILAREPSIGATLARLLIQRNLRLEKSARDWTEVSRALQAAEEAGVDPAEIVSLKCDLLIAQEKAAEAETAAATACKEHPGQQDLWILWSRLVDRSGQPEKALQILNDADKQLGDRVELRLARGWHWIGQDPKGGKETLAKLARLEENTSNFTRPELGRLRRALGNFYLQLGRTAEAERLWSQVALDEPKDLQLRLALFDIVLQQGKYDHLDPLLKAIKDIDSEGATWRYARARALIAQSKRNETSGLNEARKLLQEASNRRPTWGAPYRALANLEEIEGDVPHALDDYQQALRFGDRDPVAMRRTFQLLWNQQRFADAEKLLKEMETQEGLAPEYQRLQANLYSQQGEHGRALAEARRAAQGSGNWRDYLWLGGLLWLAGEEHRQEAESSLRKATGLPGAEKAFEPWVTLVQFLVVTKHKEKASAVIEQARKRLAPEIANLTLAQCYEAVGDLNKAAAELNGALKSSPESVAVIRHLADFLVHHGQPEQALPYLRKLIEPATKAAESDVIWARRQLALQMARLGDFDQFREALALVEENTHRGGGTLDDEKTLAILLSSHPETRRAGLEKWRAVARRQQPSLAEQLQIARLQETLKEWPEARIAYNTLASNALAATEPDLSYVVYAARALLQHNEVSEAMIWTRKLEQREPDSARTLDLRVRLLKSQDLADDATTLLKAYIQKPAANLSVAAGLFEEVGQLGPAEELFRKAAAQAKEPMSSLALAAFLGRHDHYDEALNLCLRAAEQGAIGQALDVGLAMLREAGSPTEAHCQRLDGLLDEVIKKNPNSPVPILQRAELRGLQTKFAESEALYRQVLQQDSRNIVALNNLAYLLAAQDSKLDEAMQLVNRAMAISGERGSFLDTRALIFLKLGANKEALDDLNKALLDGETSFRHFHRAMALRPSDRPAAKKDMEDAQKMQLTATKVHPLERKTYEELLDALDLN